MTENLREKAQLEAEQGTQGGEERLLVAIVEVSEGHSSFTTRATRLATDEDMKRHGWTKKRGKK